MVRDAFAHGFRNRQVTLIRLTNQHELSYEIAAQTRECTADASTNMGDEGILYRLYRDRDGDPVVWVNEAGPTEAQQQKEIDTAVDKAVSDTQREIDRAARKAETDGESGGDDNHDN